MKLWQKMLCWSVLLFIVIFNIAGLAIIESSHSSELRGELGRVLEQQQTLSSGIEVLLQDRIAHSQGLELQILRNYVAGYTRKAMPAGSYLEVLRQDGQAFYQNFPGELSSNRAELQKMKHGLQNYIIRDRGDKSYLFVSSLLTVGGEDICVSYIKDISSIYDKRQRQYLYFMAIDLGACLLFGLGIYLISRGITRPLEELTRSAQEITAGNYSQRVVYDHNDEIGVLAQSFNRMAGLIQHKMGELNEAAQQKQQFIDNFTHELRTPLTSIIGYSELLKTQDLPPEYFQTSIDNIYCEGKRLQHLSESMLKLVKLRQTNLNQEKLSAQDIFARAAQSFQIRLEHQQVKLLIEADDYEFYGDPELCAILLSNLLENALKASSKNSHVALGVFRQATQSGIFVRDEGSGIPPEALARMFEPFYTTDAARTGQNGLGLGLAICFQIARLHDWKIEVESEAGQGTLIKIIMQDQDTSILQVRQDSDIGAE
ncbi:MAG TPA: HAMP domain-containing sensor histidine kinase [Syntrophomonas sp.]|nr:HAMP domain-containing sensor histidine kinase [Syntrophomonas sp.]